MVWQVAAQIDIAMRQVLADHASYLRNTDRMAGAAARAAAAVAAAAAAHPIVLVLDSVRSAFNVGSLFRSADTAGITGANLLLNLCVYHVGVCVCV